MTRQTIGARNRRQGSRSSLTLDQYFESWIERKRRSAAKQATPYRYEHWYRNHISLSLGGKHLEDIGRQDIFRLQDSMIGKYRSSTVNYTVRILKIILNDAIADGLITQNPANKIRSIQDTGLAAVDTHHRALTEEEQCRFMTAARQSFYYEFFAMLLLTGLRHGEAATLTWSDVDYEQNVLHITKSLTFDRDGHVIIGAPKSTSSIRDIPMNTRIREVLKSQRSKALSAREHAGDGNPNAEHRIFFPRPNPDGILHNATANLALKRVLEDLETRGEHVEHFTLHAFRDTFATRFIEQGGNPQTLKTLLGHSSLAMTMDLYSHVLPNTKQKEMDRLQIII